MPPSKRLAQFLFGNQLIKALVLGLFGVLGNVLAGAYVFEITKHGTSGQFVDWSESTHTRVFWLLMVLILLMGFYGWGMTRFDTRTRRAITEAQFLGIALNELINPMIEAAKRDIEGGKTFTLEDVKKMFGPGGGQR
ncbi:MULTISPECIES: hypothetical protein [Acidiphilium]|uniref:hypothetical protein n=1 Tax=Acidiphilium TaxID=522 RepID=UPI00049486AE|nr:MULTISPECIES: hypothetical protein [Acidiphilium]